MINKKKTVDVIIEKASLRDLPYIKEKIEKYWLDGRNVLIEQFFVARNKKDVPVGFIRYTKHPTFYEPCTLAVDYYWRGKGIAAMLFGHIMSVMPKDKPVYILTHIPKFFELYGFECTNTYPKEIDEKFNSVCRISRDKVSIMRLVR